LNHVTDVLQSFDIFSLNETFVDNEKYEYGAYKDYDVHVAKAVKLSEGARKSGGVLVFVRKVFAEFVKRINVKYEHTVVLEIDKALFGLEKNVLLVCMYIHPSESRYWNVAEYGYGIEILEQCIVDLYEQFDDFSLIICGDLNARTGCVNAMPSDVDDDGLWNKANSEDDDVFARLSDDKEINSFGKELIDMCTMFDCVVLNGLRLFNFDDSLTFVSTVGGSTIDYFIMSSELCVANFVRSLQVGSMIESTHFPVSLCLLCQKECDGDESGGVDSNVLKPRWMDKLIWNTSLENVFAFCWNSDVVQDMCNCALNVLDYDVNYALKMFTDALLNASDCMRKRVLVGGQQKAQWFDEDCKVAKNKARQLLVQFRRNGEREQRQLYVEARRDYKQLIKNKKISYKREKAKYLASIGKNGKLFWKEVRQLSGRKKQGVSKQISDDQWFNHFQSLYNADTVHADYVGLLTEAGEVIDTCTELNCVITENEVRESIRHLKKGKACGSDEVMAEMLKLADSTAVCFLTKLFNVLFDSGIYPDEWAKAIIVPILKKGDCNLTTNYRGVSLLSLVSKCYTLVLNKRLVEWTEDYSKLTESQAGFRKGYSTTDHIFTLNAIVEKCFAKKGGKLYACFVDLKIAFDSVQREPLFEVLLKNGMNGKFMKAIVSVYKSVLSCVRIEDRYTDFFDCPVGLRQGCVLSPAIFSLFINEVASAVDSKGVHGIQFLPGLIELFLLLFADDIVLLSYSAMGLQNQINILEEACKALSLMINFDKTKVMVFRKGGFLSKNENWRLNGKLLDVVSEYNYLGFVFTTRMSLKRGVDALAVKGRRACMGCIKCVCRLSDVSKNCFFRIFDTQVQPVLLYASEMWGLHRLDNVEKVHTLACKRFLNVHLRVPNKFVYGELGRHPLYVNSAVRCIRYWLKLQTLDMSRIPKQAYVMLQNLDDKGKVCWVTHVKNTLFSLGFGFVWLQQSVGCVKSFISVFKQRMIDMYLQEWDGSVACKDIFENYRLFKTVFGSERYFDFVERKCFRDCLVKLRLGVLPLGASHFRRTFAKDNNFLCTLCNVPEDENHFIFDCPLFSEVRQKYINTRHRCYVNILRNGSDSDIRRLSVFMFVALKVRLDFRTNTEGV